MTKAMRSLEQKPPSISELERADLIEQPNDRRLFALLHALRRGDDPASLARRSGIDRWFIDRLATIVRLEKDGDVRELRRAGFSDSMIAALRGEAVERSAPTYKLVDTCAAEFEAATPYYYSCWEDETESVAGRFAHRAGHRVRPDSHRPGHRVRLLLGARRMVAAESRACARCWPTPTLKRCRPTSTRPTACTSSRSTSTAPPRSRRPNA